LLALSASAADGYPNTLPLGSTAPDFYLIGVDNRDWSLTDFDEAKLLLVIFTCNHCPTRQYYEEPIKNLVADYKDKGVALVAISPSKASRDTRELK